MLVLAGGELLGWGIRLGQFGVGVCVNLRVGFGPPDFPDVAECWVS